MSTNISKLKRDDLLLKISKIEDFLQQNARDANAQQLFCYLGELKKEVNGKKYGLIFEEHRESIDDILQNNLPVLSEQQDLFIDNGGQVNFLIEGDNLASLQLLQKTHKGKVDLIYIDPPYNTGNKDFVYDDNFVDTTDNFRHSKWLSFMQKRLEIAKELLSENGVIFISIDDNEQAALKLLGDEVFGEDNYITSFIWEKTQHFGRQKINYYSNSEYILCYSKKLISNGIKELLVERINTDLTDAPLYNASNPKRTLIFPKGSTKFNLSDGIYKESSSETYKLINPVTVKNGINENEFSLEFNSRWSQSAIDEEYKKGTTFWIKSENFAIRTIYHEGKESNVSPKALVFTNENNPLVAKNRFGEKVGTNENASRELTNIFGNTLFSYPKPTSLISYLLSLYFDFEKNSYKKSFTILDFFAGSGTTGHAVLKLNAEDGGNRKFILCTNNENNICRDVTYQRLKTVITGNRADTSKYSEGLPGSLKYFRVDFVPISEAEYYEYADKLLLHVRELVELENALNFSGNKSLAILLTEDELEEFCKGLKEIPKQVRNDGAQVGNDGFASETYKTAYIGHDILMSKAQKDLFKTLGIKINIIPKYYYPELNG